MSTTEMARINRESFANDWNNTELSNESLQFKWGHKSWKSCLEYARHVRKDGHVLIPRCGTGVPTRGMRSFIALWNSDIPTDALIEQMHTLPKYIRVKVKRAEKMGVAMKWRSFAGQYKNRIEKQPMVFDEKETREIMYQFRHGVDVSIIADLHDTTKKNIMGIVVENTL